MLQGAPFAYYCQMHENPGPIADIMNKCGYDFVTLGNHDFNYGFAYLERYLELLDADCICQNCISKEDGRVLFPRKILTLEDGTRVGVVGGVTDFVNVWEKKSNLAGIQIQDVFDEIRQAYEEVKEKSDFCICIYHGGYECDIDSGRRLEKSGENVGCKICRELEFDLLLAGHQHMEVKGQYLYGTYIVQNDCNARTCHEIEIQAQGGNVTIESRMVRADNRLTVSNQLLCNRFEQEVQKWLDGVVGHLPNELLPQTHLEMALEGSELADFINHVQQEYTGAEVSCTSLANEVCGIPETVHIRDVLLTCPFPNTLVVLEVPGTVLKEALERTAEYLEVQNGQIAIAESFLRPKEEHYNFDFFMGIDYKVSWDAEIGNRISDIKFQGKIFEQEGSYTVCMNNYRGSGAGGYGMYCTCKVISQYQQEMFEILLSYMERKYPPVR